MNVLSDHTHLHTTVLHILACTHTCTHVCAHTHTQHAHIRTHVYMLLTATAMYRLQMVESLELTGMDYLWKVKKEHVYTV